MLAKNPQRSLYGMTQAGHKAKGETGLRRLLDWIFGSVEAEFESGFPLDESVWRLAVATEGRFFNARPGRAASGRVDAKGVSLQRITPTSTSTTPTLYVGKFQAFNGRVYLTGRFFMPLRLRIEMAIWSAFVLFFAAALAAPAWVAAEPVPSWLLVVGAGLLIAGLGSVAVGRRQSMNDIPQLANVIANALSGTPESFRETR